MVAISATAVQSVGVTAELWAVLTLVATVGEVVDPKHVIAATEAVAVAVNKGQ